MFDKKGPDKARNPFTYPAEMLIRARDERDARFLKAFSRAKDERTFGLLQELLSSSYQQDIRMAALRCLTSLYPHEALGSVCSIITDRNDALGQPGMNWLLHEMREKKSVAFSSEFLRKMVSHEVPDIRKRAISILSLMPDQGSASLLADLLDDPDEDVRRKAADSVGDREIHGAVGRLRRMVDDAVGPTRVTALRALAKLGDRTVVLKIHDLLEGNPYLWLNGVEALYRLGEMTPAELIGRIRDKMTELKDYAFCHAATWMLWDIADEDFAGPVVELAEKGDEYGQLLAYDCIWLFDDRRVVDLVLKEAKTSPVHESVLHYLSRLEDPKVLDLILLEFERSILVSRDAMESLHAFVLRNQSADGVPDDRIRNGLLEKDTLDRLLTTLFNCYAKMRLLETRYPRKVSNNRYHCDEKRMILEIASFTDKRKGWRIIDAMLEDSSDLIRLEAALAYADIDVDTTLDALVQLFISTDNAVLRWETAGYIAQHWGNRKINELIEVLDGEDEEIIWPVIEIIGYLRSPDAFQPLRTLMEHRDWWIRASAVRALGMIGNPDSLEVLMRMRADRSEHVRYRVNEAISDSEDRNLHHS